MCTKSFKYYCYSQTKQNELMCVVLLTCYLAVVVKQDDYKGVCLESSDLGRAEILK